jgi:hypothetical protein
MAEGSQPCDPDCDCGRHQPTGYKCPLFCRCGRHAPENRAKIKERMKGNQHARRKLT